MHLVFGATGIINQLDNMEEYLKTFAVGLPFHNETGKGIKYINAQLRPIRFYDYIFPKEELAKVINTLHPETEIDSKNCVLPQTYLWALRKALKLKKIPIPAPHLGQFPMPRFDVRVVGIGIRGDSDMTFPSTMPINTIQEGI